MAKEREPRIFMAKVSGPKSATGIVASYERLIRARKASQVMQEIVGVSVATPDDVARLLNEGAKIEDLEA